MKRIAVAVLLTAVIGVTVFALTMPSQSTSESQPVGINGPAIGIAAGTP